MPKSFDEKYAEEQEKTKSARKEIANFIGHDTSSTRRDLLRTILGEADRLRGEVTTDELLENPSEHQKPSDLEHMRPVLEEGIVI